MAHDPTRRPPASKPRNPAEPTSGQTPQPPPELTAWQQRVEETLDGAGESDGFLQVYRELGKERFLAALGQTYPRLQAGLGEPQFESLCARYARLGISTGPDLNRFGATLPLFMRQLGIAPWWVELARYEWLLDEVVQAAGQPPLSLSDLAGLAPERWESAYLRRGSWVQLFAPRYPVHTAGERPPFWQREPPPALVVYRKQDAPAVLEVPPVVHSLLAALDGHTPLAHALDRACGEWPGEQSELLFQQVGPWIGQWLGQGWFEGPLRFHPPA